jgi:alpha-glucosidase
MLEENVHRGMGGGTHDRFHNAYGMLMVRASLAGILKAQPDKRPFLLTRSNYIGGHRYAATWTGDNASNWSHLRMSTPMVLNLALSGQPFVGPDIGGFGENADGALFGRWVGIGALYPFSRAHTAEGTEDHEPWVFGPETEKTCRVAIERRYRLLPYLYTIFREAAQTGLPIMRPLFFADPADPALRAEDEAFLLGADLLAVTQPQLEPTRTPARPKGVWRELRLDDVVDPELPELFIRDGAILPIGPLMQYVDEKPLDPLTLVISLDEMGEASGLLYEDAGDGFGFRNGEYRLSRYTAKQEADGVTVQRETVEGEFAVPARRLHVRVLTDTGEITVDADDNGAPVRVPLG